MPGFNIDVQDCNDSNNKGTLRHIGPQHTVETGRNHRYMLEVLEPLGNRDDGLLLFARKITRPNPEIDEITIHAGQDEIYRPGKNRWKPVEISFYERFKGTTSPLEDIAAKLIYDWWANAMITLSGSVQGNLDTYLKSAQIDMFDGFGESAWSYHLYDSWPMAITPSDLDYTDTDISLIEVKLRYSKCEEKPPSR